MFELILGSEKTMDDNESLGLATEMSDFNLSIPATSVPTLESPAGKIGSKGTAPQSEKKSQEVEDDSLNSTFIIETVEGGECRKFSSPDKHSTPLFDLEPPEELVTQASQSCVEIQNPSPIVIPAANLHLKSERKCAVSGSKPKLST